MKIGRVKCLSVGLYVLYFLMVLASSPVLAGTGRDSAANSNIDLVIAVDLNRDGKIEFRKSLYHGGKYTDLTTPERPYRFWINNDLDVVNYMGRRRVDSYDCAAANPAPPPDGSPRQQVCEQWDEETDNGTLTNTKPSVRIKTIESRRDLEDFSPIAIKLGRTNSVGKDYKLVLSAHGININLFKRVWESGDVAHSYIINTERNEQQVINANHQNGYVGALYDGESIILDSREIKSHFGDDGVGRFIFEGLHANAEDCNTGGKACFLSVELYRKGKSQAFDHLLAESKVYMDLRDVKDFYQRYSAGEAGGIGDFDAVYEATLDEIHGIKQDIYYGLEKQSKINENYILFVHGWRMRLNEKISFAETAYKRLYWSGYKGRFGAFTWPTGWFDKPAHVYADAEAMRYIINNVSNYDISEAVARRAGSNLKLLLDRLKSDGLYGNLHVFAHSMGNIVVSEALRLYVSEHEHIGVPISSSLIDSYSPTSAATISGAYDQSDSLNILHTLKNIPLLSCVIPNANNPPQLGAEAAWRCYNGVGRGDFGMPPDMYRSDYSQSVDNKVVVRHGPTTDAAMAIPTGRSYYHDLEKAAGRIVNFYSAPDAALNAWELNQLNKPSKFLLGHGGYSNEATDALDEYNDCMAGSGNTPCFPPPVFTEVTSKFTLDGNILSWSKELTEDSANILARIVPSRTKALGQADVSIASGWELGFTNSNQDHSAQFHGYYSEPSPYAGIVAKTRARYWNLLLNESLSLGELDLSGLKNSCGFEGPIK